jgi:hypothetical protein
MLIKSATIQSSASRKYIRKWNPPLEGQSLKKLSEMCYADIIFMAEWLERNLSSAWSIVKRGLHLDKPKVFWYKVIMSDESKFSIYGSDRRQLVSKLQKENLVPTVKHGGESQMVKGCMTVSGVGTLTFVDGIMKQSAANLIMPLVYKFQQDNDPKHTEEINMMWLIYSIPQLLQT